METEFYASIMLPAEILANTKLCVVSNVIYK